MRADEVRPRAAAKSSAASVAGPLSATDTAASERTNDLRDTEISTGKA